MNELEHPLFHIHPSALGQRGYDTTYIYTFTHLWSDGTTGIKLSPLELLKKLAALGLDALAPVLVPHFFPPKPLHGQTVVGLEQPPHCAAADHALVLLGLLRALPAKQPLEMRLLTYA